MRKLRNKINYPPVSQTDMVKMTDVFFPNTLIDIEKLKEEAATAATIHEYTSKAFIGWKSLPLRSLQGMTGPHASDANGQHASDDPTLFQGTPVMQPYIRSLLDVFGDHLLKVRLMKMRPFSSIGEHRDSFKGHVVRFHIPIITHNRVLFFVNGVKYHLDEGQLYRMDVSQRHAVCNNSSIERIHLVFDVKETADIKQKILDATLKTN